MRILKSPNALQERAFPLPYGITTELEVAYSIEKTSSLKLPILDEAKTQKPSTRLVEHIRKLRPIILNGRDFRIALSAIQLKF